MKAVNLIPNESRRGPGGMQKLPQGPAQIVIGVLGLLLVFVTIYVLTGNTISERQSKLTTLKSQVAQEQTLQSKLANYAAFAKLAQNRVETVREIAAARFDWHGALNSLAKVVPSNVTIQTLQGSVLPGATTTASGSGSGTSSTLRGDLSVPALVLTGCAKNQDDVAGLISRLRLMDGVTRVTLGDTADTGTGTASSTGQCPSSYPNFDLVVFYTAVPNAGSTGLDSAPAGTTSTNGATGTASTGGAQPVSTTTPSGGAQ
jgi:Tfp pilus assembly protein PilN